jgi:hypothetical protein
VFRTGPSRIKAGSPDVPEGFTVSDPPFCNPDDTVTLGAVAGTVVSEVPEPMVRLLPAETVSPPTENDPSVSRTLALPEMQASTEPPLGTPVDQLAAEAQSFDAPLPVQVSLQLSVSLGGAVPETNEEASKTIVVPAAISSPAATTPTLPAERLKDRGTWPRRPT